MLGALLISVAACGSDDPANSATALEGTGPEIGVLVQSSCAQQPVRTEGRTVATTDVSGYASFATRVSAGPVPVVVGAGSSCRVTCTLDVSARGGLFLVTSNCPNPVHAFGTPKAPPEPAVVAAPAKQPAVAERRAPQSATTDLAPKADETDSTDSKTDSTAAVAPPSRKRAPRLKRDKQMVTIECAPAGLRVFVDKKLVAAECTGSVDVELTHGVHRIELKAQPGQPRLPRTRREIEVPTAVAVKIQAREALSCTESVRRKLEAKKKVGNSELDCLRPAFADAKQEREAKLLLAYGLERLKDYAGAASALGTIAKSPRGKFDPDIHLRLAQLQLRRKKYGKCVKSAEAAWTYRTKLRGSRAKKTEAMLEITSVRAGCLEERFYATENTRYYRAAKDAYSKLASLSKSAKNTTRAKYAEERLARLKQQAESLETQ